LRVSQNEQALTEHHSWEEQETDPLNQHMQPPIRKMRPQLLR